MNVDKVRHEFYTRKITAWVKLDCLPLGTAVYLPVANPVSGIWVDMWRTHNGVMM